MLQENTVRELQELYDAYIIDLWGVVHNGVEPYSGVVECLNELLSLRVILINTTYGMLFISFLHINYLSKVKLS